METNRDYSVVFEIASKYCFSDSFVDHDGHFISSEGFLPAVVDIMVIWVPKKGNAKECSNYCTIALISYASKVMFKILQSRLQQYVNCELPDVQAGFRKGRETRDQITKHLLDHRKSKSIPEKHLFLLY